MESIRILLADDHPLFRRGVRTLLETQTDMNVVEEAEDGKSAVSKAITLQPDLVLMDLQMPGGSGITATREIRQTSPSIHVLILTMFEDDESVFLALQAGASGYVLKDSDELKLLQAVRAVAGGEAIFGHRIATRVLEYFASNRPLVSREIFPTLTEREREVLHLIAQGQSNADIARGLNLTIKTVSNYVSNIFAKLEVADRVQAVLRAREAGL